MNIFERFEKKFEEKFKNDKTVDKNYENMIPEAVNSCVYNMYKSFASFGVPEDTDLLESFSRIDSKNFHYMQLCFSELQEKYFNASLTDDVISDSKGFILYLRDFFDKITEYPHGSVTINKKGSDFQQIYEFSDLLQDIPTVTVVNPINGSFIYDFVNFNLHKNRRPVYIVYAGYDWLDTVAKLAKKALAIVFDISLLSKGTKQELNFIENNIDLLNKTFVYCRKETVKTELTIKMQNKVINNFNEISKIIRTKNCDTPKGDEKIPSTSLWLTGKLRAECKNSLEEMFNLIKERHKNEKEFHGIELLIEQTFILIQAILLEDMKLYYKTLLSKLFVYTQLRKKYIKQLPIIELCYIKETIFLHNTLSLIRYKNSIHGNVDFFNKLQYVLSHPVRLIFQIFLSFLSLKLFGIRSNIFKDLYNEDNYGTTSN